MPSHSLASSVAVLSVLSVWLFLVCAGVAFVLLLEPAFGSYRLKDLDREAGSRRTLSAELDAQNDYIESKHKNRDPVTGDDTGTIDHYSEG